MTKSDKPRFYIPNLTLEGEHRISEEEFRHAKVLRIQSGDEVNAVDGRGKLYSAIISMYKRNASITIKDIEVEEDKPTDGIILAVAPTKNIARFEWILEKATELGVINIIPLLCEHSERDQLKPERLEKIIVSAMKQCKRLWIPELAPLTDFQSMLNHPSPNKFIAHCADQTRHSANELMKSTNLVLIGPEGDFSDNEIELAINSGFKSLSLGANRLRTETAAISICAVYHLAHT